jgi:hypothetical protein
LPRLVRVDRQGCNEVEDSVGDGTVEGERLSVCGDSGGIPGSASFVSSSLSFSSSGSPLSLVQASVSSSLSSSSGDGGGGVGALSV